MHLLSCFICHLRCVWGTTDGFLIHCDLSAAPPLPLWNGLYLRCRWGTTAGTPLYQVVDKEAGTWYRAPSCSFKRIGCTVSNCCPEKALTDLLCPAECPKDCCAPALMPAEIGNQSATSKPEQLSQSLEPVTKDSCCSGGSCGDMPAKIGNQSAISKLKQLSRGKAMRLARLNTLTPMEKFEAEQAALTTQND